MNKLLILFLSILILSACSTNGVNSSIYNDGEEVVRIINQLHMQGEYNLNEKDQNIMKEFASKYPSDKVDGNSQTKDEQLIYDIYHLGAIDNNYRLAYESNDVETMNETNEEFKTKMHKIESDYGITIENK